MRGNDAISAASNRASTSANDGETSQREQRCLTKLGQRVEVDAERAMEHGSAAGDDDGTDVALELEVVDEGATAQPGPQPRRNCLGRRGRSTGRMTGASADPALDVGDRAARHDPIVLVASELGGTHVGGPQRGEIASQRCVAGGAHPEPERTGSPALDPAEHAPGVAVVERQRKSEIGEGDTTTGGGGLQLGVTGEALQVAHGIDAGTDRPLRAGPVAVGDANQRFGMPTLDAVDERTALAVTPGHLEVAAGNVVPAKIGGKLPGGEPGGECLTMEPDRVELVDAAFQRHQQPTVAPTLAELGAHDDVLGEGDERKPLLATEHRLRGAGQLDGRVVVLTTHVGLGGHQPRLG